MATLCGAVTAWRSSITITNGATRCIQRSNSGSRLSPIVLHGDAERFDGLLVLPT